MNDLDEIIRQAREADIRQAEADIGEQEALVASADARVAVAQADAAAAREKLSEARIVLEWLRRRSTPQPVAASPTKQADQPESQPQMRFGKPVPEGPPKLEQCFGALEDLGGTASNKQISNRLLRDGIVIDPDHVRGLLKYASKKPHSLVTTEPGSGVWRLVRSLNGAGGAR
jgi:hypothetical protein